MKLRLDGLRLRLLGLFFLPVSLIVLAVAIFATDVHRQAMRGLVASRDERTTASAAAALDDAINNRLSLLDLAAQSLAADSGALPELVSQADLISAFPAGFAFFNSQGQSLGGQGLLINDATLAKLLVDSTSSRRTVVARVDGQPTAVFLDSLPNVTAAGATPLSDLLESSAPALTGSGTNIGTYLVGPGPELLASAGKSPPEDLPDHIGVAAALRGENGSSFMPMPDGEHVVSYAAIPSAGWGLVVEEPWQDVTSSVLDLSLLAPFALVPVLLITLLSLWFGARRVIDPLRRLEEAASELPGGDSEPIEQPMGGIAEIEQLRESLVRMSKRVREAQSALRAYIGVITNAQEEERRRVARELHDESVQHWIALDQRLQMAVKRLKDQDNQESAMIEELHQEVQTGIQQLRRVSRGLRPIYLEDLGLVPALEMLARDTQDALNISVRFAVEGEQTRLPAESELAVFRLVQEALTNVSRHARASTVQITLDFRAERLEVRVEDDGQGFELPDHIEDLASGGHYGLMGMKERSDAVGGHLDIVPAPASGTIIRLSLPKTVT